MPWEHEEQDCVFFAAPKLVLFYFNVQGLNDTCKFHEEVPMGGNLTVCNVWINMYFLLGRWKLLGWSVGVA